ncbi:MAG: 50S ribosomal protein L18 [Deltaproteobacteria bacterium]|nr:50S ribosomal protein L18 [Deltaproteobacteria bacterium]
MAVERKNKKVTPRIRCKVRLRRKIKGSDVRPRLCVFKSDKHTYAQVISDESGRTLSCASSTEAEVTTGLPAVDAQKQDQVGARAHSSKSVLVAEQVGVVAGRRAKEKGVEQVVFDRNGYLYHGRVKAVAEGARKAGLKF